jgi:protein-serine/threonine kinase
MGLSRKSSSTNTPPLAKAQPSNGHLNNLGKTSTPTTNGTVAPAIAGHDKIHSTSTSTASSLAGSIGSGADSKELKFFDHMTGSNNNGPKSPDNAAVGTAAAVAAKEKSDKSPTSRFSRIFMPSGREKEKLREKEKEVERQKQHPEPSHSAATSPMPRHSEKEGGNSSDTDGGQSRGSSVAGDHPPKSRNVSGQHKNGEVHMIRFEMLEDGVNHVHHLRAAKRQEKLSKLVQSWLGGGQKKKDGEVVVPPKDQLSLMHTWVDQWKSEKVAVVKKDGSPPPSATLVEKYGRCQEIIGRGMSTCF